MLSTQNEKVLNNLAKTNFVSSIDSSFSPGEMITAISCEEGFKRCNPTPNEEISCPRCGGKESKRIINGKELAWACGEYSCFRKNCKEVDWEKNKDDSKKRLELSNVPKRLQGANFKDWFHSEALRGVQMDWLSNPQGTCLLSGKKGVGKTYMACAMIEHYTKGNKYRAYYYSALALKDIWIDERTNTNTPNRIKQLLNNCDLLVIDDLDKVKMSETFFEFLTSIFDTRYYEERATICTTNLSQKEFRDHVGDSMASRIFAREGLVLEIDGDDLRE